jgi:hypothetical protein
VSNGPVSSGSPGGPGGVVIGGQSYRKGWSSSSAPDDGRLAGITEQVRTGTHLAPAEVAGQVDGPSAGPRSRATFGRRKGRFGTRARYPRRHAPGARAPKVPLCREIVERTTGLEPATFCMVSSARRPGRRQECSRVHSSPGRELHSPMATWRCRVPGWTRSPPRRRRFVRLGLPHRCALARARAARPTGHRPRSPKPS